MASTADSEPSRADMKNHLPELPVELVELIARHVPDTPDFSSLRLTCRDVYNKSLDYFGKEYFTRKQFMISQFSLQTLVDISKHPVLSRYVRRVIIGIDHLQLYSHFNVTRSERLETLILQQRRMRMMAEDLPLLTEAFANLKGACEEVELRNYNQWRKRDGKRWYSYGALTIKNETGVEPTMAVSYTDMEQALSRTFSVLVSAIAASKLEPKAVLVNLRPWEHERVGLQEHAFYLPPTITSHIQTSFSNLQTLTICFDADQRFPSRSAVVKHLCIFLNLAPSLVKLRLNAIYQHVPAMDPDFSSVALPNLQSLELGYFWVSKVNLVNLIRQFGKLRHLSLFRIQLGAGHWKEVYSEIASMKKLRSLDVREMREDREKRYNVGFKKNNDEEVNEINQLVGIREAVNFKYNETQGDLGKWMEELKDRLVVADKEFFTKQRAFYGLPEEESEFDDDDGLLDEEDDEDELEILGMAGYDTSDFDEDDFGPGGIPTF